MNTNLINFINDINKISNETKKNYNNSNYLKESVCREKFITPIINLMGKNFNFTIKEEFSKEWCRLDYILSIWNIDIIVEAKAYWLKEFLWNPNQLRQLNDYYTINNAKLWILTDWINYLFFVDYKKFNVMDKNPFFSFNIANITDYEISILYQLLNLLSWLTVPDMNNVFSDNINLILSCHQTYINWIKEILYNNLPLDKKNTLKKSNYDLYDLTNLYWQNIKKIDAYYDLKDELRWILKIKYIEKELNKIEQVSCIICKGSLIKIKNNKSSTKKLYRQQILEQLKIWIDIQFKNGHYQLLNDLEFIDSDHAWYIIRAHDNWTKNVIYVKWLDINLFLLGFWNSSIYKRLNKSEINERKKDDKKYNEIKEFCLKLLKEEE